MSLSQDVIKAVAKRENVSPEELEPPLYEAVNPEALDSLFPDNYLSHGLVLFMYRGHWVVVDATKTEPSVSIREQRHRK